MKLLLVAMALVPSLAWAFPNIPMQAIDGCTTPSEYASSLRNQAACNAKFQIAIGLAASNGDLNQAVPSCAQTMADDYHASMHRATNFCIDAAVDLLRHLPTYLTDQVLSQH